MEKWKFSLMIKPEWNINLTEITNMSMYTKQFHSKADLYEALRPFSKDLDVDKMLSALNVTPRNKFYFIKKDGDQILCQNCKQFFANVVALTKLPFVSGRCFNRNDHVWAISTEDIFSGEFSVETPKKEEVVIGDVQSHYVAVKPVTCEIVEEDTIIEPTTPVEEALEENPSDDITFSLEDAQKLYMASNEKESKLRLEEYGREFGIELSRRKTFENMLKDLVSALES